MKRTMLACTLGMCGLTALAQESVPADDKVNARTELGERYYLTPSLSWVFADSGRETDDGPGLTLAFGRRLSDVFTLEAFVQYNRFDHEQVSDSADLLGLGVNSLFFPTPKAPAYLLLGAGYGEIQSHPGGDEDYGALLLNVGGGYWWQPFDLLFKGMSLRTEAVYRLDAHNDRRTGSTIDNGRKAFGDVMLSVGLNIPLGAMPEPPPPPEPEPVEVVAVAPPPDSDGDGVADDLDQCPGTPSGTQVDSTGCAVVVAPACEAPAPGEKLDLAGCGTGDVIVLEGVHFNFNQSRLTANAQTILEGVAVALEAVDPASVEIGGHTDALGSDDYNQRLSERRACAVARDLTARGIDAGRLSPVGHGEARPIADNETDDGRERNRRVELTFLEGRGAGLASCVESPAPPPPPAQAPKAEREEPVVVDEPATETEAVTEVQTTPPEPPPPENSPGEPEAAAAEAADVEPPAPPPPAVVDPAPAEETAPSPGAMSELPPETSPSADADPEPLKVVPESEVFASDAEGAAPAPPDAGEPPPTSAGDTRQVPESEVFGSEPGAASEPSGAAPVQQVPENEVFE